jgi:hypothetical protein
VGQTKEFQVARPGGFAKNPHLTAGIVEIIFALYGKPAGSQHPGDSVTKHGVAAVTDAQRPGGIGADKLNQDRRPRPMLLVPKLSPCW